MLRPVVIPTRATLAAAAVLLATGLAVPTAVGTPAAAVPSPAVSTEDVYLRPDSGVYTVSGHGFGHGRGMSQWGAQGAALRGVSYQTIVSTYYPATTLTARANATVRVRLSSISGELVTVGNSAGLTVALPDGSSVSDPQALGFRLVRSGSTMRLERLGADWQPVAGAESLSTAVTFTNTAALHRLWRSDGTSLGYRGQIVVHPGSSGMTTVDALPMESYLRTVVPSESPPSWHQEALKAQSVAARTYAAAALANPRLPGVYDICDTTSCQVFSAAISWSAGGLATSKEYASTDAAIAGSAGMTLLYAGAPAFTEFSASNGGWTTAGTQPYLVAQPDPWDDTPGNSSYAWKAQLPVSAIEARWPSIGQLTRIVVTARDGNGDWGGRVLGLRIEGSSGSVTATGESLRALRPFPDYSAGLRSPWFTLNKPPVGQFEELTAAAESISVRGWTLDPDTTASITITAYLDGPAQTGTLLGTAAADAARPDVGAAFPGMGDNHGFSVTFAAPIGDHQVCLYAVDGQASLALTPLGCRAVTVPAQATTPFGMLDEVSAGAGWIAARGWAIDPDTSGPIRVRVYLDGDGATGIRVGTLLADLDRPDVGAAYPGSGSAHGFFTTVAIPAGAHSICVVALDPVTAQTVSLGCRGATVAAPADGTPVGQLDAVSAGVGKVVARGWAIDPDTVAPISVHAYLDGEYPIGVFAASVTAGVTRKDVAFAYPGYGPGHGYRVVIATTPGWHTVCLYAINTPPGNNPSLGCRGALVR